MDDSALITCRGSAVVLGREQHLEEIVAVVFHTQIAKNMYAVSIPKMLHATEIIKSSKVFAINFVSDENAVSIISKHANDVMDKFLLAGLTSAECEKIDCQRISEAKKCLDCEVIHEFEAEEHVLFVGKIVNNNI